MTYVDSSAFVRLYLDERYSTQVRTLLSTPLSMVCVAIGYVEVRAALGAARRANRLNGQAFAHAKHAFEKQWQDCDQLPVDADLLTRAADFSEFGSLRAYDAIHLAAAEYIKLAGYPQLQFLSFDLALIRAAKMLGIRCVAFEDV